MRRAVVLLALLAAACGPVTRAQAERDCAARIGAPEPTGIARMGYSSPGGFQSSVEINLGVQAGSGRDLSAEYDACVFRQTGELPSRPLFPR